jgi:uncharacterized membrane protein YbhN (UPF0104 family)
MSSSSDARPAANDNRRVSVRSAVRVAAGTVLVVYLIKTGGVWPRLTELPAALSLIALLNLAGLVGAATEARRLMIMASTQRIRVSFVTAFRLVCVATLFNLWIPGGTGGDVMKLYYLAGRNRERGIELATALLVDRVIALFTLILVILALLLLTTDAVRSAGLVRGLATAAVLVLVLVSGGTLTVWSTVVRRARWYKRLVGMPFAGPYLGRAADAAYGFRNQKTPLTEAAFWCIVGHFILAASFALTAIIVMPTVSTVAATALSLLGIVANALPITPGGVGVGEAATEGLFRSVGATGGAVLMVLWRFSRAAMCALGGIFFLYGPLPLPRIASPEPV